LFVFKVVLFVKVKAAVVEVAGAEMICAEYCCTVAVASVVTEITVAPEATLTRAGDGVPAEIVATDEVAFDGTTESIPKPKAATATSAMRLKVVFVDICFLSISRVREFPALGFG
jgi:hypothetical protein